MDLDIRILGPLEVLDQEGRQVDLGAPRQRAVLAVLIDHLNEVVSVDRLVDDVWGGVPPRSAHASLQVYVSNLRRALEPDRARRAPSTVIVSEGPGYVLRLSPDRVDATRFEQLATDGRRALAGGDAGGALGRFDAALASWRGDVLADFTYDAFAAATIARLDELRWCVEEDRVEARLAGGDLAGAAAALGRLVPLHPMRERLRALQMRVLYGAGRQAEALRVYDEVRVLLTEELGVAPSPELQRLHRQVLDHDPLLESEVAAPRTHDGSGFVGRDGVLARLLAAVDDVRRGEVRLVLVEGEAGIGKTRLAEELAARARDGGVRVVWGHCHDDDGSPPLWPWVQVLRGLLGDELAVPGHLRSTLAALLPELGPAASDDLIPEVARYRLFDAVRETMARGAASDPSLVVIDDLQWADDVSLRLLAFLAIELHDAAIGVLVTFRTAEVPETSRLHEALADVARRPGAERLVLHGLTEGDVADLLRATDGVPDREVGPLAAGLQRRTEGNPFFITELVRLMQSERRLTADAVTADVPTPVTDVLRRRIGRLPADARTLLETASVIGREVAVEVLAHACGIDPEQLEETLEPAVAARVIVEDRAARYRFTHGLVSETLYSDLPPARRSRLHHRVAVAIEVVGQAELSRHYSELAHHYAQAPAGASDRAVEYARLAGQQATARLAYDDAVRHWRGAASMLERLGDATSDRRARVLLELAAAERRAGHLAAAASVHDEALAVARGAGDPTLVAELAIAYGEVDLWQVREYGTVDDNIVGAISEALAALDAGDSPLRARLLTGLAVAAYFREGARDHSKALVRDAVAMARRLGDATLLAAALMELLVMLDNEPDPSEQLAAAAELRTLQFPLVPREAAAAAASRLARVALAAGDASTLDHEIARIDGEARAARRLDESMWAAWAGTTVAFLRGRYDDAERAAGEAFELHRRLGIWGAEETFLLHAVFIWREQGRMVDMAPFVEPLLAQWVHPNTGKIRALFALERGAPHEIADLLGPDPLPRFADFTWITDACITAELAAAADLPCCAALYDLILPYAGRVATMDGTFVCLGAVSYYLGLLAESLGRDDDARRHLDAAIELDERIGAVPWTRRARARRA